MLRVFEPSLTWNDKFTVLKTLYKNNISGQSPSVSEFEEACANKFDRKYGISVSNGSVALDIALQSLGLKEDDEVILPSFTIISCLAAIVRTGAKPIFCDVDSKTWNMRLEDIEKVYTSKTRAVLIVHTYGLTAEATKISNFCKENDLILIEDAAEAHGQVENSKKCGSFGLISSLSFYANKHVTTGEGGMVMTNSDKYASTLRQMRNLDFTPENRFQHDNFYWNYRLGGIQAALGLSQLDNLQKTIEFKIKQGNYYLDLFKDLDDLIQVPLKESRGTINHYWVFGIVPKNNIKRIDLVNKLLDKGVETRPFFWPLHLQKALSTKQKVGSLKTSEMLGKNGLYIPMGRHINKSSQEMIVQEIKNILLN